MIIFVIEILRKIEKILFQFKNAKQIEIFILEYF